MVHTVTLAHIQMHVLQLMCTVWWWWVYVVPIQTLPLLKKYCSDPDSYSSPGPNLKPDINFIETNISLILLLDDPAHLTCRHSPIQCNVSPITCKLHQVYKTHKKKGGNTIKKAATVFFLWVLYAWRCLWWGKCCANLASVSRCARLSKRRIKLLSAKHA